MWMGCEEVGMAFARAALHPPHMGTPPRTVRKEVRIALGHHVPMPSYCSRTEELTEIPVPPILTVSKFREVNTRFEGENNHGPQEARTGSEKPLSVLHEGRLPAAGVCRL